MSKSIDPKELVLVHNFPPDAWRTVIVRAKGELEYGDFLSLEVTLQEYAELLEEVDENEQVYIVPAWHGSWHEDEVNALIRAAGARRRARQ